MIKIVIKENQVLLENIKYPEDVFNQIKKISDAAYAKKIETYQTEVTAYYRDIFNFDSPSLKDGLVCFSILNILGFEKIPENVISFWDSKTGSFKKELFNKIKDTPLKIRVILDPEKEKAHVDLAIAKSGDKSINKISVVLNNNLLHSLGGSKRDQAIKHELRHIFSQLIPNMCIEYGKQLKETKDPKKITKLKKFTEVKSTFGVGSSPIGKEAPSADQVEKSGLKPHEAIKQYLVSDSEFEVWMSDLVHYYLEWLEKKKFVTKSIIDSSTPEDVAINFASKLISDISLRKSFTRSNDEYSIFFSFIQEVLKARPKEFPSKLVRYLTNAIKEKY